MRTRGGIYFIFVFGLLTLLLPDRTLKCQVRSGAAFLKMLPGARVQSMAGAATAVFDDPNSVFANPAAASFFRQWEWSAGYTKWIADITNASVVYGRKAPMPWSREMRIGFGILYQGTSSFNNNSSVMPQASASDFMASISVGQPATFLSKNISLGGNFKYFASNLAQYSAHSFVYDFGILAKTDALNLGKSLKGLFSFGAAVNQNGRDLTYIEMGTPLPRTARLGAAACLGFQKGTRLMLTADYISVKDESPYAALGGELLINRFLAVNAGYDFGSDLFKKFTFGASIRLDDVSMPFGNAFPGKHNAVHLDFATLDGSDFFSHTYRGTVTHFSSNPEPFQIASPAIGDSIHSSHFMLRWQPSRELDVFDDVTYHVLVDRDSATIADFISTYDENPELFWALLNNPLILNQKTTDTFMPMGISSGGNYYWTVAAVDKDKQVQFAANGSSAIAHFCVARTDLEIKDIQFDYNPTISMDNYQGRIKVLVKNNGDQTLHNVVVRLQDDIERFDFNMEALAFAGNNASLPPRSLGDLLVAEIQPGEQKEIDTKWQTPILGKHKISAEIDPDIHLNELNRLNNKIEKSFYTIPKGGFSADNESPTVVASTVVVEKPFINQITFAANSSVVKSEYLEQGGDLPVLSILAKRLGENPALSISLQGFADPNSNENSIDLAEQRANAVMQALVNRGVSSAQIVIKAGRLSPKRRLPADSTDAEMLREEQRYVEISAAEEAEAVLMRPVESRESRIAENELHFSSDITSSISLKTGEALFATQNLKARKKLDLANAKKSPAVVWQLPRQNALEWLDQEISCSLSFQDSLGRSFKTQAKIITVQRTDEIRRRILNIPLEFGKTEPSSDVAWQRVLDAAGTLMQDSTMHIRIQGHACAIGAKEVNDKLSKARAIFFDNRLKSYLESNRKEFATDVLSRVDAPLGLGESNESVSDSLENSLNLGDNNTSLGRKLNRRIEIVFYRGDETSE